MEPTFDEFLALAEERLDLAALAITDGAIVSGATCAALSAATRAMITLSTRYGLTPHGTPVVAWQPQFNDLLTEADRYLRRHANPEAAPSSADELIGDAARLVTVARDLLATHLTVPDPPRPFARTPAGADLLEIPARELLLRRTAEFATHLARVVSTAELFDNLTHQRPHLADAYRPRDRDLSDAARELANAAHYQPEPTTTPIQVPAAPVMSAPIAYPQPNEEPIQAANQLREALNRLATATYQAAHRLNTGEHPPVHTAGNLRESASNLALAHVLAADLLIRLTPHLPPVPGWDPLRSAKQLRAAGAAWAKLRRPWEHTGSVPDSTARSPLTVQATGIPLRLGRLLYADPTWTPRHGPGQPRPLGDLLAADVLDAVCAALSTLPRAAATIAADHARLITDRRLDLHSTDPAHRAEGESRRFYPLRSAQHAEFTNGYQAAARACKTAAADLAPLSRGHQALRTAALIQVQAPAASRLPTETLRAHQALGQPTIGPSIILQP